MAHPTYTDVTAACRAYLNDATTAGGATYDDAFLQTYIQLAQQTLVNNLAANSVREIQFRTTFTVTAATSTDNVILQYTDDTATVTNGQKLLPVNLIQPVQLFERQAGGVESDFIAMTGPQQLPRITQMGTLGYWEWMSGRIYLLGATQNREVRLDYLGDLGAVQTDSTQQPIVTSGNALALLACCYAARARGQGDLAATFATFNPDGSIGGQAGWEIQQIISINIRTQQSQPERRQPMFGRDRYANQTGWTRWRY